MAKILKDAEMGRIIHDATHDNGIIGDADAYAHFLEDLGELMGAHFGGDRGAVSAPDFAGDGLGWTCGFHANECVPDDGGVFKDYDTDVIWKNGKEEPL